MWKREWGQGQSDPPGLSADYIFPGLLLRSSSPGQGLGARGQCSAVSFQTFLASMRSMIVREVGFCCSCHHNPSCLGPWFKNMVLVIRVELSSSGVGFSVFTFHKDAVEFCEPSWMVSGSFHLGLARHPGTQSHCPSSISTQYFIHGRWPFVQLSWCPCVAGYIWWSFEKTRMLFSQVPHLGGVGGVLSLYRTLFVQPCPKPMG